MISPLIVLDESAVIRLRKAVRSDSDLLVWVGDWLSHLNLFSDAQVYDILGFVKKDIESFEESLIAGRDQQVITLAICDSRWVSITGTPSFLDTKVSELVTEMDQFAVTHIMCDIAALAARMNYRQGRFSGQPNRNEAAAEPHEASQQQQHQPSPVEDNTPDHAGD